MEMDKLNMFEKKAYETIYAEPEETFHRKFIPKVVADFIPQFNLNKDDFILDIGCGPGVFLQEMKDLHYTHVAGITLSKEDHDICIKKGLVARMSSMSDIDLMMGWWISFGVDMPLNIHHIHYLLCLNLIVYSKRVEKHTLKYLRPIVIDHMNLILIIILFWVMRCGVIYL